MTIQDITHKLGIEPNTMQLAVIEAVAHTDRDVVVLSETGSGKTLSYLMPLTQLVDSQDNRLQAVVIVPGRELALQSATVMKDMGSGIRSMACYGGRPTMDEHRVMRQVKPQVIFATPGRMNDHLDKGNIQADGVRLLVIDEFDKCLAMGFQEEMKALLSKIPMSVRHILLSATDAEAIPGYVNLSHCERIDFLSHDEQIPDRIHVFQVRSPQKDKLETLSRLLRYAGSERSIVFLNYRDSVERTANWLLAEGFGVSWFHGGLEQKQREDALYKFSNGSSNVLVSTDLASRGLDIPDIDNIIHYHLPESEDGYIHRVGRTARWDAEGRAFFVLGPDEEIPSYVDEGVEDFHLPEQLDAPSQPLMATLYIGKGKKDKLSKGDVVGFLCKKGGLKAGEIGRIDVKERYVYAAVKREKIKQVINLTRGEKIKGIRTILEEVR